MPYKDKEKQREANKRWRENNKEKQKEYMKEYYEKNKEQLNQKNKEYYQKNKDRIKQTVKEYSQENKEKIKEYNQTPKRKKCNRINNWNQRGIVPPCSWDEFYDEYEKAINCADCDVVMTIDINKTPTTKCVDHDHTITDGSPNFRAFVCHACNIRRG